MSLNLPPLILASQSPRRQELLSRLGLPFTVCPAHVDETELPGEAPLDYVRRVARAKAAAVAAANPGACVLAADTPVICGDEILQSPYTPGAAAAMLRKQSGKRVDVPTVVVVQTADGQVLEETVESWVQFKPIGEAEVAAYITHEAEWQGISGAFKVQGLAAAFITATGGTPSGIMGLPLAQTADLLRHAGYTVLGC
jgi:septum formation protein